MIRLPPISTLFPTRRSSDLDTIARSFLKSVEIRGDRPAIREKKFGIWQPTSWREWLQISKDIAFRSEEHTSELQSLTNLVCRLLLEKKKKKKKKTDITSSQT